MSNGKSESQAVELLGCGHGSTAGAVQLPLLDHVHGINSGDQFVRAPKRLEAHHRICDSLHRPVVLLDKVVEILGLAKFDVVQKRQFSGNTGVAIPPSKIRKIRRFTGLPYSMQPLHS